MKTKILLIAAIAALAILPSLAMAQDKGAGAKKLMQPQTIKEVQQMEAGDTIVMSCPKCKDMYVTKATKSMKAMTPGQVTTMVEHLCPGCTTCNACGSTDVTCCLMKKGDGPTTGMEEKK